MEDNRPKLEQIPDSRTFFLILSALAAASIIAFGLAHVHKRSGDLSREAQGAFKQIATRAQEIYNLEWLIVSAQEVSPDAEAQVKAAKEEITAAMATVRGLDHSRKTADQVSSALNSYLQSADQEFQLIRAGQFEEARRFDFQEVNPQFDLLLVALNEAVEGQGRLADLSAMKSRSELAAGGLVTAAILVLWLRFQRRKHLVQLMIAKQAALAYSEERFRALTEKSTDVVFITDATGGTTYVAPSVGTTLGLEGSTLIGKSMIDLVHPDDVAKVRAAMSVVSGQNQRLEFRLRHLDGRWLYFECVLRDLLNQPTINGLVFNAREVTERKMAEEQLEHNASHDQLTGLPNRVVFLNRLQAVIDRIKRHPQQMAAVLFVDVDDFKVVNDCLGHAAGDELIIEIGKRLQGCMRTDGTIARMGGDEFTVLLEEVSDPSDAIRVAQRIHGALTKPFVLMGQEVFKDASIGIALTTENASAETMLQNADLAMYRAKSKGKGCSELFDGAMHEQVMGRLQMEAQLRRALENNELRLYYQPIVNAATGVVEGFEALARWQPAGGNFVPPNVFIPLAEQCGLIVQLGSWILITACQEAVSWQARHPSDPPLYVSINVSARQFAHPSFVAHVREAIEKTGLNPRCVRLELTETTAMKDAPSTEHTMAQLHALGVKLSIDDFGTGYSSLSYLRRFPVETLKIDQSFVSKMETNRENYAIVTTVVALARSLGMAVVAEGVETADQLEKLQSADCDSAQGYLFSKPLPADAIDRFIHVNRQTRSAMATSAGRA